MLSLIAVVTLGWFPPGDAPGLAASRVDPGLMRTGGWGGLPWGVREYTGPIDDSPLYGELAWWSFQHSHCKGRWWCRSGQCGGVSYPVAGCPGGACGPPAPGVPFGSPAPGVPFGPPAPGVPFGSPAPGAPFGPPPALMPVPPPGLVSGARNLPTGR